MYMYHYLEITVHAPLTGGRTPGRKKVKKSLISDNGACTGMRGKRVLSLRPAVSTF